MLRIELLEVDKTARANRVRIPGHLGALFVKPQALFRELGVIFDHLGQLADFHGGYEKLLRSEMRLFMIEASELRLSRNQRERFRAHA